MSHAWRFKPEADEYNVGEVRSCSGIDRFQTFHGRGAETQSSRGCEFRQVGQKTWLICGPWGLDLGTPALRSLVMFLKVGRVRSVHLDEVEADDVVSLCGDWSSVMGDVLQALQKFALTLRKHKRRLMSHDSVEVDAGTDW